MSDECTIAGVYFVRSIMLVFMLAGPAMGAAWQGLDVGGNRVEVPASDRVCVLLFLQPGQSHSQREMMELRKAVEAFDIAGMQIVAVVSGPNAGRQAASVEAKEWPWPVVLDEQYACSGQFDVHAWPTTVILDKTGKTVAHLPGFARMYTARVEAYLNFAGGKSTRAELDRQLSDFSIVQDSTDEKARQHLLIFDRLFASGRPAEAEVQLQQAHDLAPAAGQIRLHMARAMLLLSQAQAADDLLATLDAAAVGPGELALLRGEAAIALERWPEAKRLLLDARQQGISAAETEYYLGLLYLHENDGREAAGCFRKAYEAATRPAGQK